MTKLRRLRPDPLEVRRVLARLGGARLSFGKPVRVGDRAVIPVAQVRVSGGFGFGGGADDGGAGGGGALSSRPVGFIDAGPEGARFEPIAGRGARTRTILVAGAAGALAGAGVAGTAVGAVAAGRLARAARRALPGPPRRPALGRRARPAAAAALTGRLRRPARARPRRS